MGELYIDHEYWITFVQLAMAMFAMGATLHVHDFQATILHLLGFDHEKLTYRFQGRDFRLTDIHGQVVGGILA